MRLKLVGESEEEEDRIVNKKNPVVPPHPYS
jgi:hypothetical protein